MKVKGQAQVFLFTFAAIVLDEVNGLSSTNAEAANLAKGRLQESLSSPSRKITISPEIIIPEPSDPTALLLQSTDVTKLSDGMRNKAKANAAFITGSFNSVKTFCSEQESARGNFPGPLPVIYCGEKDMEYAELAEAGVAGILHSVLSGEEVSSAEEISKDDTLKASFESAIENGIQLIPEIVMNSEVTWDEGMTKSLVDAIAEQCGSEPVALVLTVGTELLDEDEGEKKEDTDNPTNNLPKVPKGTIPIIGSVRAMAGGGRIGASVAACKEAGFNGVMLRCDCLPGYRMNPDLDFVGGFWGAAIGDLKSTKSKNFNFRSKVALEKDVPMEWYNYQKDVMESGALGESGSGPGANPLDTDSGDYQGF